MGIVYTTLKSSSGCGIFCAIWKALSNCNTFRQQSHRSSATPPGCSDRGRSPSATQPDLETGLCSAFASHSPQVLLAVSASESSLLPQPTMQFSAAQEQQQLNGGASGSQHISPSKIKTQVSPAGICACNVAYFKVTRVTARLTARHYFIFADCLEGGTTTSKPSHSCLPS